MGLSRRRSGPLLPAPERVLTALRSVGGGVSVRELAYQTTLAESEVIDALDNLERHGLATPWAWTLGPEAAK